MAGRFGPIGGALAALVLASAAAFAVSSCASAPSGDQIAASRYSSYDTPISVLLSDQAARAVLERHIPQFVQGGDNPLIRNTTLRAIQGYAFALLTDEVLGQIDAELAQITPAHLPVPVSLTNVNEARVTPYTLPDPLRLQNGRRVRDAETWWTQRRPEILSLYETNVYGRAPGRPADQSFDVFDQGTPAFGGRAIRKQVMIHLSNAPNAPEIQLVEYLPAAARGPVPMLLMIHFTPVSQAFDDPDIRPGMMWDQATGQRVPARATPGMGRMDIQRFLDAGFGVAAFYYGDVDPDFRAGYPHGIRGVLDGGTDETRAPDAWGSIAAWGWGMSRVQDYLETDPAVDSRRVAIYGASRLGKTVLWAAARDQRFAAVVACCSGELGASLMRRNFGETLRDANSGEGQHWTARNLQRYYEDVDALPVDSHMLLALIAPRPVLLQTGRYDLAADPHGEFLAQVAASPVYELLGADGVDASQWPSREPILGDLGYHMNNAGHGPAPGDWDIYLQFLQRHLQPAP